jgi:hypothetical protein
MTLLQLLVLGSVFSWIFLETSIPANLQDKQ